MTKLAVISLKRDQARVVFDALQHYAETLYCYSGEAEIRKAVEAEHLAARIWERFRDD